MLRESSCLTPRASQFLRRHNTTWSSSRANACTVMCRCTGTVVVRCLEPDRSKANLASSFSLHLEYEKKGSIPEIWSMRRCVSSVHPADLITIRCLGSADPLRSALTFIWSYRGPLPPRHVSSSPPTTINCCRGWGWNLLLFFSTAGCFTLRRFEFRWYRYPALSIYHLHRGLFAESRLERTPGSLSSERLAPEADAWRQLCLIHILYTSYIHNHFCLCGCFALI